MAEMMVMSLAEMQDAGYGSPPYHPGCRGLLVPLGSVDTSIPLGGNDGDQQEPFEDQLGLGDLIDMISADSAEDVAAHAASSTWSPAEVDEL